MVQLSRVEGCEPAETGTTAPEEFGRSGVDGTISMQVGRPPHARTIRPRALAILGGTARPSLRTSPGTTTLAFLPSAKVPNDTRSALIPLVYHYNEKQSHRLLQLPPGPFRGDRLRRLIRCAHSEMLINSAQASPQISISEIASGQIVGHFCEHERIRIERRNQQVVD